MLKDRAVATLSGKALLRPTTVREALRANDRLKLLLTLLQAAAQRAMSPRTETVDLSREIAATDIGHYEDPARLRDLPNLAHAEPDGIRVPGLSTLRIRLAEDLSIMAAPLLGTADAPGAFDERIAAWRRRLDGAGDGDRLTADELAALTHARRDLHDSLHQLVMDLHKAINALAETLAELNVAGANAWGLAEDGSDAPRIAAFMQGVNRTAPLKLDHPGLDTTATRDGDRLLIQNDIGTNDAHVLVIQVQGLDTTLTYSDLHRQRFAFFQRALAAVGADWRDSGRRTADDLNDGEAFSVGTACFHARDEADLHRQLTSIGASIVFLIDWNRARRQLAALAGKRIAVEVLEATMARGCGHMAWLAAGGARLVWDAMAAQPDADFRLGETLTDVLPPDAAHDLLSELAALAWRAASTRQPPAFVADQARLLVRRCLAGRHRGLALLAEHAALCHALAQSLEDTLTRGALRDPALVAQQARRAADWERRADELVSQARAQAERQSRWRPYALLTAAADDIADAIEEASFTLALIVEAPEPEHDAALDETLERLARSLVQGVRDHVRLLQIATTLEADDDGGETGEFLDTLWRIQQAEREGDRLCRDARLAATRGLRRVPTYVLSVQVAEAMESASDALLRFGWRLREHALARPAGAMR